MSTLKEQYEAKKHSINIASAPVQSAPRTQSKSDWEMSLADFLWEEVEVTLDSGNKQTGRCTIINGVGVTLVDPKRVIQKGKIVMVELLAKK
jgi:hypothetical protein